MVRKSRPQTNLFVAACCFGGGFLVAALGVYLHQIWIVYLGYGVIGGIGLGLGYVSPVSTLIKWFPDRRGMATGMAIMGFGGGAMIGAPLSILLMEHFQSASSVGVMETFIIMGRESLLLRKLILGIQAQVRGKSLTGRIKICDALIRPASTYKNPRGVFI